MDKKVVVHIQNGVFMYLCAQSCPTLCNTMDCSPPGSSVHGISQTILEWVAISFSRELPDPGVEPASPAWQVDSLTLSHLGSPRVCILCAYQFKKLKKQKNKKLCVAQLGLSQVAQW